MENTVKKVSYREFTKALHELQNAFGGYNSDIRFEHEEIDGIIQINVNIAASGTMTPIDAYEFAQDINRAAKAAEEFEYAGYKLVY